MASETDVRIARAVALKAAVELVNGNVILLADLEAKATELVTFLLDINPARHETSDPGEPPPATPPDVWLEEDRRPSRQGGSRVPLEYESGPPRTGAAETRHCGSAPEDSQGCGARLEWKEGVSAAGKDYAMWACPNKKKTNDPAEQAAEKVRHPVQYPPK